jgi:WD40 repeat protein
LERKVFKEYQQHKETVTVIKADRQENFCVTGSQEGQCIVWTVKEGDLTKKFSLTDFESAILDIFLLEESYLMAVGSAEGKVLVVNMYTREVMRTLHHPQGFSVNKLCLSLQPFGSLLFYSEMDGSLYSYSVNGQMLKHKKVKGKKVICMQVGIDSKNQDFVVSSS